MSGRGVAAFLFCLIAALAPIPPGRASDSEKPVPARSHRLERIAFTWAALLARERSELPTVGALEDKCPAAGLRRGWDLPIRRSANGGMVQQQIAPIGGSALRDPASRQAIVGAAILGGLRRERSASCAPGPGLTPSASSSSAVELRRFLEADNGNSRAGFAPAEAEGAARWAAADPIGSPMSTVEASSASTASERGEAARRPPVPRDSLPSLRVTLDPLENDLDAASDSIETGCAPGGGQGTGCRGEIGGSDAARFRLPLRASITRRFGEREGEQRLRGVVLSTDHAQPILAPGDGVVAYAGPFRGIGSLLIIEHRDAYHSLVIGASRLEVRAGDVVSEGQAVGWLARGPTGNSELYVELRRAGEPVDPMSLLSALEGEVRG